jgi:hypothetical protein
MILTGKTTWVDQEVGGGEKGLECFP